MAAEFRAELKELNTLPTSTAAKKPKDQSGITAFTSLGGRRFRRHHAPPVGALERVTDGVNVSVFWGGWRDLEGVSEGDGVRRVSGFRV